MRNAIYFFVLLLSVNVFASGAEISVVDVQFGRKLPFEPVYQDVPLPSRGFVSFRLAQPQNAPINQFYDFEVRATNPDLLVYSVEGARAYPSQERCASENLELHEYFKTRKDYTAVSSDIDSFASANGNSNVRISCLIKGGSPSWQLVLRIYDPALMKEWEG